MLRDIFNSPNASIILKILLQNSMSAIIEYPSYKILAHSENLSPGLNLNDFMPRDTSHDIARISQHHGEEAHKFRINRITSSWLVTFKRESLSSLELFRLDDIPIFHNDVLVGIKCSFKEITLNDISFMNILLDTNLLDPDENIKKNNNLSEMEKQILFLAALNKSNKQISAINESLGIRKVEYSTIKTLISQRIYKKLNVKTLDQAITKAVETKQLNKIPELLLSSLLRDYYLIETKENYINI
ncbi:MAG: helix-turn-helix transcriptional regulator [Burkholderiales bacterium]|nr:helix-turn-helix transcriptional regulator [Burkholderiales bacterium]